MEKNYYHVQISSQQAFEVNHSSNPLSMEKIGSPLVQKITYANGDELLQVVNGDKLDIYASFPIDLTVH